MTWEEMLAGLAGKTIQTAELIENRVEHTEYEELILSFDDGTQFRAVTRDAESRASWLRMSFDNGEGWKLGFFTATTGRPGASE